MATNKGKLEIYRYSKKRESTDLKKILVIEDDPVIRSTIETVLSTAGFEATLTASLGQGRTSALENHFDLFLMDLELPDGHGFDLCREFQSENPGVPIIIITASLAEDTAVQGLSLGAVDYVRKPFGSKELLLRIRRHLKDRQGRLSIGDLVLDFEKRLLTWQGEPVPLAPKEWTIISELWSRLGEVVPKENLLAKIDEEGESMDHILKSHISRLRRKLNAAGVDTVKVEANYGVGYRLVKLS